MVRQPDATMQATPQDSQLMSKHRVLSLKPQLRLERRAQDGQNETKQPDHSAGLGDSITSSTRTGFSVHTPKMSARNSDGTSASFRSAPPTFRNEWKAFRSSAAFVTATFWILIQSP